MARTKSSATMKLRVSLTTNKWLLVVASCVALAVILLSASPRAHAKSINDEDLRQPTAAAGGTSGGTPLELDLSSLSRKPKSTEPDEVSRPLASNQVNDQITTTLKPATSTTLRDFIDKLTTSVLAQLTQPTSTTTSRPVVELAASTTKEPRVVSIAEKPAAIETTTTKEDENELAEGESAENDEPSADDACKGLSGSERDAQGRPLSGAARLVNLQSCMQSKIKRRLAGSTRTSMELFEKLSLSGSCTASLMSLMGSLGELKSFAFKFFDASAKIPSGMMYGLLSDFGDFDQCLSIRSDPRVAPRDEEEERTFSGKYCLLSVRLKYHVNLVNSSEVPEGIIPDGILWDELVRQYWLTNSTKGFQVGVCVPSRCNQDDLEQIFRLMAENYYFDGQVTSCQDSNDLLRQQSPDWLQLSILYAFVLILVLNVLASLLVRYSYAGVCYKNRPRPFSQELIRCFSLQRNWRIFLGASGSCTRPLLAHSTSHLVEDASARSSVSSTDDNFDSSFMEATCSSTSSSSFDSHGQEEFEKPEVEVQENKKASYLQQQLVVKILPTTGQQAECKYDDPLSHLSGLKLLVILWITAGHSFLYPSANNYQYYRSIINMNITRDSVWFAATNFTLGTDMLLYMTGLLFVYKLGATGSERHTQPRQARAAPAGGIALAAQLIARRILRFWPVYLSVIALAIIVPLASDGPMWPEMVSSRLGATCRSHWWANLLMINNFYEEHNVCLPSSWFVSVLMQCLLVGSLLIVVARKYCLKLALAALALVLLLSSGASFVLAYVYQVGAPAIKMDESFVMELDSKIFRMYTSTLNNLGPFLIGMLGGFMLIRWRHKLAASVATSKLAASCGSASSPRVTLSPGQLNARHLKKQVQNKSLPSPLTPPHLASGRSNYSRESQIEQLSSWMFQLNCAFAITLIGALVLSSVFFASYTRTWAALYWSTHRVGWALVTGYVIHQCATGRWQLIKDLLSLSALAPLSRLIFIAYLVFPIFIHIHSGLVRDGLHVSIYNMLNIYTTRLVMTFTLALALHLLIELPFCSLGELLLNRWRASRRNKLSRRDGSGVQTREAVSSRDRVTKAITIETTCSEDDSREKIIHPLLAMVPPQELAKVEQNQTPAEKLHLSEAAAAAEKCAQ